MGQSIPVGPIALTAENATLFAARRRHMKLTGVVLTNTTDEQRSVTVAVVPEDAGIASATHVLSGLPVASHDIVSRECTIGLRPGDSLPGSSSDIGINFWATVEEN